MERRGFVGALLALAGTTLSSKITKADGVIQTVTNRGQIVSTGDVWVDQSAGGLQTVYDSTGRVIAVQDVGNGLQVVSTGDVHTTQSAAGQQTVYSQKGGGGGGGGQCDPGEYYQSGSCAYWCSDQCEWLQHCCDDKKKCCR